MIAHRLDTFLRICYHVRRLLSPACWCLTSFCQLLSHPIFSHCSWVCNFEACTSNIKWKESLASIETREGQKPKLETVAYLPTDWNVIPRDSSQSQIMEFGANIDISSLELESTVSPLIALPRAGCEPLVWNSSSRLSRLWFILINPGSGGGLNNQ